MATTGHPDIAAARARKAESLASRVAAAGVVDTPVAMISGAADRRASRDRGEGSDPRTGRAVKSTVMAAVAMQRHARR
jgi:hypothetical protein